MTLHEEDVDASSKAKFNAAFSNINAELKRVEGNFSNHVVGLLGLLGKHSTSSTLTNSHALSSLMVRFDFNEFYRRKAHPTSSDD
jgi:hypothetical protein